MPRQTRSINPNPEVEPTVVIAEIDGVGAPAESQREPTPVLAQPVASPQPPAGKLGQIYRLIAAVGGATVDDLVAATGWQPHTIRAAFSRLRRRGLPVVLATDAEGRKAYRLDVREG
ncbi:MAG: DUF3489 domain-containing protein [Hyphomicrobiales bacterium]|nr:DUF3489 domain-containing protein [Hyphomicrobiales bacterium]